jgi:hypothetical protein
LLTAPLSTYPLEFIFTLRRLFSAIDSCSIIGIKELRVLTAVSNLPMSALTVALV